MQHDTVATFNFSHLVGPHTVEHELSIFKWRHATTQGKGAKWTPICYSMFHKNEQTIEQADPCTRHQTGGLDKPCRIFGRGCVPNFQKCFSELRQLANKSVRDMCTLVYIYPYIYRPSVRPSVRLYVRMSVCMNVCMYVCILFWRSLQVQHQ